MKTICSFLLVLAALTGVTQTSAPSEPATATIDAAKTGPPISPYVYGQFLEHAGSLIYSSLGSDVALTVAVLNPTEVEQLFKLKINGTALSSKGTLWRLASADSSGQNPSISNLPVDSIPELLKLPRFSANIYELPVKE